MLKRTHSRCPVCRMACPAEVWREGNRILLRRTCPEHGTAEACIASDARFYWQAQGNPKNQCCGGKCVSADGVAAGTLGRNADGAAGENPAEKLATCLALIEIVNSCNLACPTCYADSPRSTAVDAVPLEDLQQRIRSVIARKGGIEILQLSGAVSPRCIHGSLSCWSGSTRSRRSTTFC